MSIGKKNRVFATMEALAKNIGLPQNKIPYRCKEDYAEAMRVMPDGDFEWLTEEYAEDAIKYFTLEDEFAKLYKEAIAELKEDPALCQYAWLMHYILYMSPVKYFESWGWYLPKRAAAMKVSMLPSVILLSGVKASRAAFAANGYKYVEEADLRSRIRSACRVNTEGGMHGVNMGMMGWDSIYIKGHIVDVIRLAFEKQRLYLPIFVYKSEKTGECITFIKKGMYSPDGYKPVYDDGEGVIHTKIVEDENTITGNPVAGDGKVSAETVTVDKSEWKLVLEEGDNVYSVHIGSGSPLDQERVKQSYEKALTYCKKVFPDFEAKAFFCYSWLLGIGLEEYLNGDSNIIQFARQYHRMPMDSSSDDVLQFLFGVDSSVPYEDLPENSSLQRNIKKHLMSGREMECGEGFILIE